MVPGSFSVECGVCSTTTASHIYTHTHTHMHIYDNEAGTDNGKFPELPGVPRVPPEIQHEATGCPLEEGRRVWISGQSEHGRGWQTDWVSVTFQWSQLSILPSVHANSLHTQTHSHLHLLNTLVQTHSEHITQVHQIYTDHFTQRKYLPHLSRLYYSGCLPYNTQHSFYVCLLLLLYERTCEVWLIVYVRRGSLLFFFTEYPSGLSSPCTHTNTEHAHLCSLLVSCFSVQMWLANSRELARTGVVWWRRTGWLTLFGLSVPAPWSAPVGKKVKMANQLKRRPKIDVTASLYGHGNAVRINDQKLNF